MLDSKKTKLIVVDDHTIVRHGLCRAFSLESDFTVIAETDSGRSAVEFALWSPPDMVLMDIGMPDMNGIEATRQILANNSRIKVVALTMHAEKIYIMGMLNAGVSGYMLKSCSFEELIDCIRTILTGKMFFCEEARQVITDNSNPFVTDQPVSVFSMLSNKEREVLQLIAEGRKNTNIADTLNISVRTVEVHRAHLKKKLNLQSVAELTKFAISQGITASEIQ